MRHDWDEAFGLREKKVDYYDKPLVKMLFPLGGVLIALIGLLISAHSLPTWALGVLVAFVATCVCVLVWPVCAWCIGSFRARSRRNRAARLFYPDVEQTVRRLHEHLSQNHTNTLMYELREFTSLRDKQGNTIIQSLTEATNINEWLSSVDGKLAKRRNPDFAEVVGAASLAAAQYRRLAESLQNRFQYLLNQSLLDEQNQRKLRSAWSRARDSYTVLMQDWARTCDKINHELGDFVGPGHFSPLSNLD